MGSPRALLGWVGRTLGKDLAGHAGEFIREGIQQFVNYCGELGGRGGVGWYLFPKTALWLAGSDPRISGGRRGVEETNSCRQAEFHG